MSSNTLPPPGRHLPEIHQLFTIQMAHDGGFPPVVSRVIRGDGRFRCFGYRTSLRNIYILCEDNVVVMLTSNRRFVELAYTIEPK